MTMTAAMGGASAARSPRDVAGGRPGMGRVVRAVVLKELRQNWVNVALVICLEFIIVCVAEWFRSGWLFDSIRDNQINNVLLLPSVQMSMMLGPAVAGLLLGVLQPLGDRSFDLWAFLNHRPVPRWWLFVGRGLAGVIMYGIVAVLPVGFAMAIAPTKLAGPFFISEYWLPPIADLLAGFVYYVAGLVVMEREARWYGSRVVVLVGALVGSYVSDSVYSFWVAAGWSVVLMGVYGVAAWGSGVSHGFTLRAPRVGRWALVVVVLGGFGVLTGVPTVTGVEKVLGRRSDLLRNRDWAPGLWSHQDRIVYHSRALMPDGTIANVVTTDTWDSKKPEYRRTAVYTDLQGNPLAAPTGDENYNAWNQFVNFAGRVVSGVRRSSFRELGYDVQRISGPIWHTRYMNEWYWVPNRQLFYVYKQLNWEAMMGDERRKAWRDAKYLGEFGVNGLQRGNAQPFEGASVDYFDDIRMVDTPKAIYVLDPEHITLKPFFVAKNGEEITGAQVMPTEAAKSLPDPKGLLIFTTRRVVEVTRDGREVFSLPFLEDRADHYIVLHRLAKVREWVLEYYRRPEIGKPLGRERTFEFYDDAGKLLKREKVSWEGRVEEREPELLPRGVRKLHRYEYRAGAIAGLGGPLGFGWIWMKRGFYEWAEVQGRWTQAFELSWRFVVPGVVLIVGWAVGIWVLAWGYARGVRSRVGWAGLAVVFGPAALLTFVAVHRMPRWVRCRGCGGLRLRRGEKCGRCG
ncbi:MAG: hypothetical protein ACTHN5_08455, partial [Phycisphaerae bacterium]